MPAAITFHGRGETATDLQVGDFLLTGRTSRRFLSEAIKLGARLRGYPEEAQEYSHAALVISPEGDIAEALAHGVERNHIGKYHLDDYKLVHTRVAPHDRAQIRYYADEVLGARTHYGIPTLLGLALYCATGAQLCIQHAGTAICSGFVADALTRAGFVFARPPFAMMPADLEAFFAGPDAERQQAEEGALEARPGAGEQPPATAVLPG